MSFTSSQLTIVD